MRLNRFPHFRLCARWRFTLAAVGLVAAAGCQPALDPSPNSVREAALTTNVTIKATELSAERLYVSGVDRVFDSGEAQVLQLAPGNYDLRQYNLDDDIGAFQVDANGHVQYDPSREGIFTGAGTTTLTVHGVLIAIDATALSAQRLWINDWLVSSATAQPLTVIPTTYRVLQYDSANEVGAFTVARDGTISFEPALAKVFSLPDPRTLKLSGVTVSLDARLSPVPQRIHFMGGDLVFQSSEVQQYTVLPGTYGLESYDYVLPPFGTFTVAADGTVDYDAALDSIFSGRGTTVLGIIAPNAMPTDCGVMRAGEGLRNGQSLSSCDGKFTLAIRDTGELLLYLDTIPVWLLDPDYYKKVLSGRIALSMRPDGTLVYEALDGYKSGSLGFPPGSPLFALNPFGAGSSLIFLDDGNLAIVNGGQRMLLTGVPQQRFRRNSTFLGPPDLRTYRFPDSFDSSVPLDRIPPWLAAGNAIEAISTSEQSAETWIFDQDASGKFVRPRLPGLDDFWLGGTQPPYETINAAKLPYTVADGQTQTTDLASWSRPIRMIRNYDHGVCYAKSSYATMAQQFGVEILKQLIGCWASTVNVNADVVPTFHDDPIVGFGSEKLTWGVYINGSKFYYTPLCSAETDLALGLVMTHYLYVNHDDPYSGEQTPGTRVKVGNFSRVRGRDLPGYDVPDHGGVFEDVPNHVYDSFESFGKRLGGKINQKFILPDLEALLTNADTIRSGKTIPWDKLHACTTDNDCRVGGVPQASPDDGCFFTDIDHDQLINESLVSREDSGILAGINLGVCVNRLQPKRVNLLPDGLQVVLAETEDDPQRFLLDLLAKAGTVECPGTPMTTTNPAPVQPIRVSGGAFYGGHTP